MKFHALSFLFVILTGCTSTLRDTSAPPNSLNGLEAVGYDRKLDWPAPRYAKVIGYRFKLPEDDSTHSLVKMERLNMEKLVLHKITETRLNQAQVNRLTGAIVNPKIIFPVAACHLPRHIFIFYDENDAPISAIEVCFECNNIVLCGCKTVSMRRTSEGVIGRGDFAELAKLSDELGLGCGKETLPVYLRELAKMRAKDVEYWKRDAAEKLKEVKS